MITPQALHVLVNYAIVTEHHVTLNLVEAICPRRQGRYSWYTTGAQREERAKEIIKDAVKSLKDLPAEGYILTMLRLTDNAPRLEGDALYEEAGKFYGVSISTARSPHYRKHHVNRLTRALYAYIRRQG